MRDHAKSHAAARLLLGSVALMLAAGLAGCYTLMRHPAAEDPTAGASDECVGCHDQREPVELSVYPWVDYYSYSASPWINYYGAPWWYDFTWERCEACDGSEPSQADPDYVLDGRNGWGRRVRPETATDDATTRERGSGAYAPVPVLSPPPVPPAVAARPSAPASTTEPDKPTEEPQKEEPERPRGFRR